MDGLGLRKIWKDGKPTVGVLFFLSEKRLMRTYCMILFNFFWNPAVMSASKYRLMAIFLMKSIDI